MKHLLAVSLLVAGIWILGDEKSPIESRAEREAKEKIFRLIGKKKPKPVAPKPKPVPRPAPPIMEIDPVDKIKPMPIDRIKPVPVPKPLPPPEKIVKPAPVSPMPIYMPKPRPPVTILPVEPMPPIVKPKPVPPKLVLPVWLIKSKFKGKISLKEMLKQRHSMNHLKNESCISIGNAISSNMSAAEAAAINYALKNYVNASSKNRAAAKALLDATLAQQMKNAAARSTVSEACGNLVSERSVDMPAARMALLKEKMERILKSSSVSETVKKTVRNTVGSLVKNGGIPTAAGLQTALLKSGVPKTAATALASSLQNSFGDAGDITALKLAGSDAAQELVTKYVGRKGAVVINTAIEEYMSAEGNAKTSAEKALDTALNTYVRDPASNAALKQAVADVKTGKTPDYQGVGTALAKHEMDKMIDNSNLSANQKKLAHAAIAELAGEDDALLNATGEYVKAKLVKKGIPVDKAQNISGNIQKFLADTGNTAALKAAATEGAQEFVSKCVGKKGAAVINAAIGTYMSAEGDSTSAAEAALSQAIDSYVRDPASNAALKKAFSDLKAGNTPDYQSVGTALAKHEADKLIDSSNLSANEKKLAHAAIAELAGENGAFLNATSVHIEAKLIKAGVPADKAKGIAGNMHSFLENTRNTEALKTAATETVQELVNQYVGGKGAEVINSAIKEYRSAGGSAKSAAEAALNSALDQYVRDPASNAALKKAFADLKAGNTIDYKGTATALARYGADKLIDNSNLSANQKKLAHAAIAELAGEDGALLNATGEYIEAKLTKKGIPAESAKSISGNIQKFLADTGNTEALKAAASESAQGIVSKYAGEKGAAVINAAIKEYMNATGDAKSAAGAALNTAIDKYVKGDDAKKALKDALEKTKNGENVDYKQVGSTVFNSYALDAIENSNMSDEEKEAARSAIASLNGEVPWSETGAEAVEALLIKAGVSKENAGALAGQIIGFVKGDVGIGDVAKSAVTVFSSAVEKAIDKQLTKWSKKYPFLGKLFKKFGIDGKSIVKFFKDLSLEKIKNFFKEITSKSLDDWIQIGKALLNKALDKAIQAVTKYLTKFVGKILEWLKKKVIAVLSKVHFLEKYMEYVKLGVGIASDYASQKANEWIKTGVEQGGAKIRSLWEKKDQNKKELQHAQ